MPIAAALVHLYTASGAVLAFLAARAVVELRLRDAFAWLALQIIVDATDGALARAARVSVVLPQVDGTRMDDIVDYLTYVFVPAMMVVWAGLVPGGAGLAVAAAMLLSSAFGFSRTDAKTADHFFTGFPSYWNIVVLYLVAFGAGSLVSAGVLLLLAALVFVPVGYVYPSRTPILRAPTLLLGAVWGLLMLWTIAALPDVPRTVLLASLVFPVYYVGLSLVLHRRRAPAPRS